MTLWIGPAVHRGKSLLWRIASDAVAKIINPAWPAPHGLKRQPVKTLITLARPGVRSWSFTCEEPA